MNISFAKFEAFQLICSLQAWYGTVIMHIQKEFQSTAPVHSEKARTVLFSKKLSLPYRTYTYRTAMLDCKS